jgi:hypothetical protein
MGINQKVVKKLEEICLNYNNGSFKLPGKNDNFQNFILYKNGTVTYYYNGCHIKHRFETLFMSNDLSSAVMTCINGNRYNILLEEKYPPTIIIE